MKILFDHQIFTWQKLGGISRYFAEIINYTSKRKDVQYQLSTINSINIHFNELELRKNFFSRILNYLKIFINSSFKHTGNFNLVNSVNDLKNQQFDVFVPTYYDNYFLEYIGNKPFVLTVYDMIQELYPTNFKDIDHLIVQKRNLIYKAKKIIAISENTKKDIINIYPDIDKNKIEVVYLSHSIKPMETKLNIKIPEKYILFVGERGGYKNFDFFIKSVYPILNKDENLFVFCVGGRAFTDEESNLFNSLKIQNQLIQHTATDGELYTLYNKALVFVFPSLYEGFGIPILEAMASKCPVVLSNASSFPEIALDAAVYFNTNEESNLEKKISQMIYDENYRALYIEKGLENLKRFSWQKTTDECIEVYKSALTYL